MIEALHRSPAPLEQGNDALHELDELVERWAERLTVKNLALAERYLKADLHVVCIAEFN